MNPVASPFPEGGVVYFAQCSRGGPIKIGFTTMRWAGRLAEIRRDGVRAYPLALVLGTSSLELKFHAAFERHHLGGEWFEPVPELLEAIASLHGGTFDYSALPEGWCVTKPYQTKASLAHWGPLESIAA